MKSKKLVVFITVFTLTLSIMQNILSQTVKANEIPLPFTYNLENNNCTSPKVIPPIDIDKLAKDINNNNAKETKTFDPNNTYRIFMNLLSLGICTTYYICGKKKSKLQKNKGVEKYEN